MIEELYNAILTRFEEKKQILIDLGILEALVIDMYVGQPDNPDAFELTTPAVFIDYSIDWDNEVIYVDAHVIMEYEQETENYALNRSLGLRYLKLLSFVRYCLHGLKSERLGKLKITLEKPASASDFHYHIISFRTSFSQSVNDLIGLETKWIETEITAKIEGNLQQKLPMEITI